MKFSKKFVAFLAAFVLFLCTTDLKAQDFEGVVYYKTPASTSAQMGEMAYMIKGNKVRMEMGSGQNTVAVLYQPESAETIVIIDRMQAFMKMDTKGQASGNMAGAKVAAPEVEKTGQTKTIAGRSCEVWTITHESGENFSMCMNEELGPFVTPKNPISNQQAPAWAQSIETGAAFPLEIKQTGNENKMILQATKIEEKSLEASLFEVPENYRDMSSMMKDMQNRN